MGTQFDLWDWSVVAGYFVLVTVFAGRLAGKQATIRDFFLAGRKIPWYAVSASIVATEISAITIVGVPAIAYAQGGNFAYLQLGIFGSIFARLIVAWLFVPVFYEREIYSPYEYIGSRLGPRARSICNVLFALGGMLGQGARVYATALVLELMLHDTPVAAWAQSLGVSPLIFCIWLIGSVAVLWTLMGGIRTVIWTDAMLFLVFFGGSVSAVFYAVSQLSGGWSELVEIGRAAGKFRFFNLDPDPTVPFTFWAAIIGTTWSGVAVYGTDQLMAQRMFCCRSARDARWAIVASSVGQIITATALLLGVAIYAYYLAHPPPDGVAKAIAEDTDRVMPAFVMTEMAKLRIPIAGLVVAGIFAAAVSSLDSILAALSQVTLATVYLPLRRRYLRVNDGTDSLDALESHSDTHHVRIARIFVVAWGIVLCLMAHVALAASGKFPELLNLAQSMAAYTGGALLTGFVLAMLGRRDMARGFAFSGPLSVVLIFALVWWHQAWAQWTCWVFGLATLTAWGWNLRRASVRRGVMQTWILAGAVALIIALSHWGPGILERTSVVSVGRLTLATLAWPWWVCVASLFAFVLAWALRDSVTESQRTELHKP